MRRTSRRRRHAPSARGIAGLALLALLAGVLWCPATAEATPGAPDAPTACPESVLDRYEPGDEVTVVGYTAGCLAPAEDPAASPVVAGYLHADPCAQVDLPYCTALRGLPDPADGTALGDFTLAPANEPARGQRMELTFRLPAGMATGLYYLVVCREPCAPQATPSAATPLYVGVDPPPDGRPVRHWPLDDPAVGDLPDDALVSPAEGRTLTGAEARAATGASPSADPTELMTVEPDTAPGRPPGDAEPWSPPGWSLALALVLVVAAVAARRSTGRKQVHRSDHPGQPDHPDRAGVL